MKSKKTMVVIVVIALIILTTFVLSKFDNNSSDNKEVTDNTVSTSCIEKIKEYVYDDLQNIFFKITENITPTELIELSEQYNIKQTTEEYNGYINYKFAYSDDIATQFRPKTGDYLLVSFDTENKLRYAEYFNAEAYHKLKGFYVALFYCSGGYDKIYDDDKMAKDYSGYYCEKKDLKNDDGIEVEYNNGNVVKTDLYSYKSASEAINQIIDNK